MNKIIHWDCLEEMKNIETWSIDMILCDLPYAETWNQWDNKIIDTALLFEQYERIIKEDWAIVLTATMKFALELITKAKHLYKYDYIWEKDNWTNAPNVNLQPFRVHEFVLVFWKWRVTNGTRTAMKYFPQKTEWVPYKQMAWKMSKNWKGWLTQVVTDNQDWARHPKTIQKFTRDRWLHPTQKPVALFEFLIKTYTNEWDLVLDNCAWSWTTWVACKNLNRSYILIEKEKEYIDTIWARMYDNIIK